MRSLSRTRLHRQSPLGPLVSMLLLSLLPVGQSSASVLIVEAAGQGAAIERGARQLDVEPELALKAGDRLRSGDSAVNLLLARHGRVDLGGNSVLTVEMLPHATFAADLRTVLRVSGGRVHVVWKHPQLSMRWPLHVRFGDFGTTLAPGEYFIVHDDSADGVSEVCVVDGRLTLTRSTSPKVDTLSNEGCYRALSDGAPASSDTEPDESEWARRRLALRAPSAVDEEDIPPVVAVAQRIPAVSQPIRKPIRPATTEPATAGSSRGGDWVVNVASLSALETAERMGRELQAAGFETRVIQADAKGRRWFRVQVLGYARVVDARRVADRLAADFGYKGAWVTAR